MSTQPQKPSKKSNKKQAKEKRVLKLKNNLEQLQKLVCSEMELVSKTDELFTPLTDVFKAVESLCPSTYLKQVETTTNTSTMTTGEIGMATIFLSPFTLLKEVQEAKADADDIKRTKRKIVLDVESFQKQLKGGKIPNFMTEGNNVI